MLGYSKADDLLGKDLHNLIHHTRPDGSPYPVEQRHILEAFWHGDTAHIDDEVIWRRQNHSWPNTGLIPFWQGKQAIGSVVTCC